MSRVKLFALAALLACISVPAYGVLTVDVLWKDANSKDLIRIYSNPFDPDLTYSYTGTQAPGVTIASTPDWGTSQLPRIVSWRTHQSSTGSGRIRAPGANATTGFGGQAGWITFQAATDFQVGTVITFLRNSGNTGGPSPMPYWLSLGTGGKDADWANIDSVISGGFGNDETRFQVYTAPSVGTYDSFRLDGQTRIDGYFDFNDVVLLPDRLERLSNVTVTARISSSSTAAYLVDMNHDAHANAGWASASNNENGDTLTFTFKNDEGIVTAQGIDAIVFFGLENLGTVFTLQYKDAKGDLIDLADVTMRDSSMGYVLPLEFLQTLETDTIVMELPAGARYNLRQVMFFTKLPDVPEPATMSLLALGGLALLRRRAR